MQFHIILGETFHIGHRSFTHIYPYDEADPSGPVRTHKETCKHMENASSTGNTVRYMYMYALIKYQKPVYILLNTCIFPYIHVHVDIWSERAFLAMYSC